MKKGDFRRKLRAADQEWQDRSVSEDRERERDERIWSRLGAAAPRRSQPRIWVPVAAAVACVAVAVIVWGRMSAPGPGGSSVFEVVSQSADVSLELRGGLLQLNAGSCKV